MNTPYKDPAAALPVAPGNERWTWEGCYTNGTSMYKCTTCRKDVIALTPELAELNHDCPGGKYPPRP